MKYILSFICLISLQVSLSQQSSQALEKTIKKLSNKAINIATSNQDSAYYYFKQSIKVAASNKHWNYAMDSYFEMYNTAFYHNNFTKRQSTLFTIDSLYNSQKNYFNTLENSLKYKNHINFYYGFYYYRLNNYEAAKNRFQKIIDNTANADNSQLLKNKTFLSVAYSYVAKMNTDEGKYALSKALYDKNIRFLKTIDSTNNDLIYSNYNLLAEVLKKENKHKQSNSYFLKFLNYYDNKGGSNNIMSSCFNIAKNYIQLKKIDSAKFYLKKAKQYLDINHMYNVNYYKLYSEIYDNENNYEKALNELNKALDFYKKKATRSYKNNQYIAITNSDIGELHQKYDDPNKAINHYNIAINLFQNDSIKSSINQINLLKTLKLKAITLNNLNNPIETINTVNYAISILDKLRPTFRYNDDKLFFIENAFPLFESGIEACFALDSKSNNNSYIDQAFLYAEKSKSVLLLEALLSSKATSYANIPKNIIEEGDVLKYKITTLEKKLNVNKTETLKEELTNLKLEHTNYVKRLESNYKNYFNLKYNSKGISLKKTQQLLSKKDMLISYFYGENAIYAFGITKNTKQLKRITLDYNFNDSVKLTYKMLSNPKSNLELLRKNLESLHDKIIAPINKLNQNLIIVADGLLNYIPFAALIDNKSNYLLEKHNISYINSATLLQQLQAKKSNNGKLLAFAPSFNNSNLLALPNNLKEAKDCADYFKGQVLGHDNATLQNFNTKSTNYSILHLATHAVFNDEAPEFSFLAFTTKNRQSGYLYTKDLYNLKLNANLVTLSACESGIGDLKRGEGLLSLARGFYFSGAQSISSTLWKINDASSAALMSDFYKNLSNGQPKDLALQQAKLTFVKQNKDNALSHPYYWSAFVISGNTEPLTSTHYWLWIIAGILLIVILGILLKKKNS